MKPLPKISFFIALLFTALVGYTQPTEEDFEKESYETLYHTAFGLSQDHFHAQAIPIWKYLVKKNPNNAHLNYQLGYSYLQIDKVNDAFEPIQIAQTNTDKNYTPQNPKEEHAPYEAIFYFGELLHLKGETKKAIIAFQTFIDKTSGKHSLTNASELHIRQCHNADSLVAQPTNYVIENMGPMINSSYAEYSPIITLDGTSLFFTSRRLRDDEANKRDVSPQDGKFYEDIYVARQNDNGQWQKPKLVEFSQTDRNEASVSTSASGQQIFVYQDDDGDGNIYVSNMYDTIFSEIAYFDGNLNSEYWESHACISPDGNTIFFVSDRKGGYGGRDIYRIKKLPTGDWSLAQNLGPQINTQYDEEAPFIGADGKTMYYASNGTMSIGGFDLLAAQFDDEVSNWTPPKNMGYPLNSFGDDIFYTTSADGYTGFFASQRNDSEGEQDIYIAQSPTTFISNVAIMKGQIKMEDGSLIPKNIKIIVTHTASGQKRGYTPRRGDGGYVFDLQPCESYHINYTLDDQSFYETDIDVPCKSSYQEINRVLKINPLTMKANQEGYELAYESLVGKRWQLSKLGFNEDYIGAKVLIYDNDDLMLYEELVNKKGQFPYRTLEDQSTYIMKVVSEDEPLCDSITIELVDENGKVYKVVEKDKDCEFIYNIKSIASDHVQYQENFGYNNYSIDAAQKFNDFVDAVAHLLNSGNQITIYIESSASTVPTKKYASNKKLAQKRLIEAKKRFEKALKAKGLKNTHIQYIEKSHIQGPAYNKDANANKEKYRKYQYVRFELR